MGGWWKRIQTLLTRPLPLVPVLGSILVVADPEWQTEVAVVSLSVCWCATLLYNVPMVARVMFTRPTYLEDVERPFASFESAEERDLRVRTRQWFNHTVILTTSLSLGAVIEYGLFRFQDSQLAPLELAGIVGGLLSLFADVHVTIGKILLVFLNYRRNLYMSRARKRKSEIELKVLTSSCPPSSSRATSSCPPSSAATSSSSGQVRQGWPLV